MVKMEESPFSDDESKVLVGRRLTDTPRSLYRSQTHCVVKRDRQQTRKWWLIGGREVVQRFNFDSDCADATGNDQARVSPASHGCRVTQRGRRIRQRCNYACSDISMLPPDLLRRRTMPRHPGGINRARLYWCDLHFNGHP